MGSGQFRPATAHLCTGVENGFTGSPGVPVTGLSQPRVTQNRLFHGDLLYPVTGWNEVTGAYYGSVESPMVDAGLTHSFGIPHSGSSECTF